MSEQRTLDLASDESPAFEVGDRVDVPLYGASWSEGVVTAVDSHTSPDAPYSRLVWVRVEEGPEWVVGDETSYYAHRLEAA